MNDKLKIKKKYTYEIDFKLVDDDSVFVEENIKPKLLDELVFYM